MKLGQWLRAAVVAVLLDESRAAATTTYSAPVRNSEGDALACFAQNHSSVAVDVDAVLRDETGAEMHNLSSARSYGSSSTEEEEQR